MKKQITLAIGLAVVSTGALASKARLEALGENAGGSYYLNDARNVFLNPANINFHKDLITLEAGQSGQVADDASAPKAEGGFYKSNGSLVYGLHFGNTDQQVEKLQTSANLAAVSMNTWDFFVGGDAGVLWGANLSYADHKNETGANDIKGSLLKTRVGVIAGDIEARLRFSLTDKLEEDNTAEYNVKTQYELGVNYKLMNDSSVFFETTNLTAEEKTAGTEDYKATTMMLGYGKVKKLNDKATMNYSVAYKNSKVEGSSAFNNTNETKQTMVDVTIGVEAVAKEWLTLRGSVSQTIFGDEENNAGDKKSFTDSTAIALGAALTFGDLTVDGLIGNDTNADGTAGDANGVIRTDSLMSRVSATYRF